MSELTLTARDLDIVRKVFQCLKSPDALKIDTEKLAQLAGFSNGRSANASWCVIKKKLMGGNDDPAATNSDKATTGNVEEAVSPTKATPKKGGPATKAKTPGEGEADDETTPSPKKKGARKPKAVPAATEVKSRVNDATTNGDAATTEGAATADGTPTPKKRVRGPNKVKDPNAPPAKRAKKSADVKSEAAVTADESAEDSAAANSQFDGNGSLFRDGPGAIKTEDHATEDLPFTEKGQKILNEELNGSFTHGIAA